jgi:hypothetical protein
VTRPGSAPSPSTVASSWPSAKAEGTARARRQGLPAWTSAQDRCGPSRPQAASSLSTGVTCGWARVTQ